MLFYKWFENYRGTLLLLISIVAYFKKDTQYFYVLLTTIY